MTSAMTTATTTTMTTTTSTSHPHHQRNMYAYINIPNFKPSNSTFRLFPELPAELQTMIWQFAAKDWVTALPLDADVFSRRDDEYGLALDVDHLGNGNWLSLEPPPLLWTTRLARDLMMDALAWGCMEDLRKYYAKPEGPFEWMKDLFYLLLENLREREVTTRYTVMADFRVCSSVMGRVRGEDGVWRFVPATKEEREKGQVRVFWSADELYEL